MRQTSRAVALLLTLESAHAIDRVRVQNQPNLAAGVAYGTNFFNPTAASIVLPSTVLNSRTAPYANVNPNAILATKESGAKWLDAVAQTGKAGSSAVNGTNGVGSGCMQCLNGTATAGVWCSRTYSYLETANTYMYQTTSYLAGRMQLVSSTDAEQLGGNALDQGACCETQNLFSKWIGTLAAPQATYSNPTSSASINGVTMIAQACPAVQGGLWGAGAAPASVWDLTLAQLEASTTIWTSWWCSNGLFKKVTTAGNMTANNTQIIPQGVNKRLELAQIGCPQKATPCGQATNGTDFAVELTALAKIKSYDMPVGGTFTVNDKCTWVAYATVLAPTFTLLNSTGTGKFGLKSSAYQIHNMEYTSGSGNFAIASQSLQGSAASAGFQQLAPALSLTTMLPLFWMPADQFGSLRTWYGQGAAVTDVATQQSQNWMSPGQAAIDNNDSSSLQLAGVKSQLYGNVANVPMSGVASGTATTGSATALGASENYGKYNTIYFDLRQMRYFPAKVAQTVHQSGKALQLQYTTALGAYNTAKTTWDAYVAILEKNAKQDAFAALFSPPKAPTVPPLPNMPWVPAAYNGYVRATADQVAAYTASAAAPTSVASPTAQQFWTSLSAAQTNGGWGSFTATIFTFRNGWGKSFGTIGYSGDADALKMSDVWNYKWTCAANSVVGAAASTTSQCANTYSATPGLAASTGIQTNANTVKMITVVSLWATSNSNTAGDVAPTTTLWATNGFKLTFTGSDWKSGIVGLTALPVNTAPVAAKSLTGIAGAQALAATSAAALAVAAALY